jgi:hypothetical protein
MPTMQDTLSVAANAVSANVLAGQLYEWVPAGARVTLSALGAATGMRTTLINGVPVVNDQAIAFVAASQFPIIPDHIVTQFAAPGGRLVLTFRNTTAGAIVTGWRIDLG